MHSALQAVRCSLPLLLASLILKLDLHDAVETHLPPHIHAPTFLGQSITLAHLASHTSGLPSTPTNLISTDGSNPFADYSPGAMLEFLNSFTLTRAPGARYEYSNYGAGLLGYLLAELCQTTYPLLVKQQITDVLQLNDTTIEPNPEQRTRLAQGYSGVVPTPEFRMGTLEGAGALRSTAHDVLDFLAANRGWIPSPLQSAMLSAQQPYTTTPTPGLQVGLGWHRLSLSTGTALFHDGATIGQRAFAGFLNQGNLLVVVLGNSVLDVSLLGLHLLDPAIALAPLPVPTTLPEETLRHYVGWYGSNPQDRFAITLLDGHLVLEHSSGPGRYFTLYPNRPNRFYLVFPDAQATFTTNSTGRSLALAWTQEGHTTSYPKAQRPAKLTFTRSIDSLQLGLLGDTDQSYLVETSTNLTTWSVLTTNTIWDIITLEDSPHLPRRFFRTLKLPGE
jgi:serine-type D-Ala-D-Ala carboxypeptidase/endopeptidase